MEIVPLMQTGQGRYLIGTSIKYVTLFLMIFDPPSPCHKLSQILDLPPPLKVCHTFEQKVNKQISRRMETVWNNYNHYCILYILNNKRPYSMGVSNKPWNTLTSLISYNSEGDSCSLNMYYAW